MRFALPFLACAVAFSPLRAPVHRHTRLREREDGIASDTVSLGSLERLAGNYEGALTAFQRVVELQPNYTRGHAMVGAVLARLRRWDQAIAALRRATTMDNHDVPSWGNLGACLRQNNQIEHAIVAYQQGLEHNPANPDLLNNLAVALRRAGRVEEAIEMASAATQSEERHRLATDRPPLREYVGNF